MERILENLPMLTWQHYLFAACVAYVITYIYRVFSRMAEKQKEIRKNGEKTMVIKTFDRQAVDRCKELFPIDVLAFKGREFKRGTQIKVTTSQNNTIIGEFIGLSYANLVCIKTVNNKIIAHQLEKIEEVTNAE
ncbi:MAG: hypothetical protein IKU21_03995 [Anaerotignum sp.]|nr:hypothetical protein [Anaerotignum sp.]